MFVATGKKVYESFKSGKIPKAKSEIGGLSPRFEVLIRIAGIIACSSFAAYMVGNMLIAVNRYSALRLKDRYEEHGMRFNRFVKVWNRRNVRIIIGLQYGCAFAAFTPLFKAEYIFLQNADGTYIMGLDRRSDLVSFVTMSGIVP
ncbi:hypothetical protein COOONC_25605 [Cooperia oncophora]